MIKQKDGICDSCHRWRVLQCMERGEHLGLKSDQFICQSCWFEKMVDSYLKKMGI